MAETCSKRVVYFDELSDGLLYRNTQIPSLFNELVTWDNMFVIEDEQRSSRVWRRVKKEERECYGTL